MSNSIELIVKVFLLATGLSLVIKYIGINYTITATPAKALIAVFAPTILMISWLTWKARKKS